MNLHELLSTGGLIEPLKELTVDELRELAAQVADEITRKAEKQFAVVELSYNAYKGSGKCWVAKVDPQTKAKLGFLDSTARDPRDWFKKLINELIADRSAVIAKIFESRLSDGTVNWAHEALLLMDKTNDLINFCSVHMPNATRYTEGARSFWAVCHLLAAERERLKKESEP